MRPGKACGIHLKQLEADIQINSKAMLMMVSQSTDR